MVGGRSAPAGPARFWAGLRRWARPGTSRRTRVVSCGRGRGSTGGGGCTSPASPPPPRWHREARSRISPVPALTSRQRRRILSHAIWRARRSPAHCGGRGRGQRGRCPPWSQEAAAGPPPAAWGRGRGWRLPGLGWSPSAPTAGRPPPSVPPPQHSAARSPGSPLLRGRPGSPHLCPQPGSPRSGCSRGGRPGLAHLLPRPPRGRANPAHTGHLPAGLTWGARRLAALGGSERRGR